CTRLKPCDSRPHRRFISLSLSLASFPPGYCRSSAPKIAPSAAVMELSTQLLLDTPTLAVRDVLCAGTCRHRSDEECAESTCLVFPYRGVFVRHLGGTDAVAEANQVLF